MSSKASLTIFIFLILSNILTFAQYSDCGTNGNYTGGSTYQANLNSLLLPLSTNIDYYGFGNASVGENPDRANAIALCRGDVPLETCRSCVQTAIVDLLRSCPAQRQAVRFENFCKVRYSNASILGIVANTPGYREWNLQNVTSPSEFLTDLRTLLDNLRELAANSLHRVAAGNRTTSDFQAIYALVQCTPDISNGDCNNCLMGAAHELGQCCGSSIAAMIYHPSCNLYYAVNNAFFNGTRLQELLSVPIPPVSTPPVPTPQIMPSPPLSSQSVHEDKLHSPSADYAENFIDNIDQFKKFKTQ